MKYDNIHICPIKPVSSVFDVYFYKYRRLTEPGILSDILTQHTFNDDFFFKHEKLLRWDEHIFNHSPSDLSIIPDTDWRAISYIDLNQNKSWCILKVKCCTAVLIRNAIKST